MIEAPAKLKFCKSLDIMSDSFAIFTEGRIEAFKKFTWKPPSLIFILPGMRLTSGRIPLNYLMKSMKGNIYRTHLFASLREASGEVQVNFLQFMMLLPVRFGCFYCKFPSDCPYNHRQIG